MYRVGKERIIYSNTHKEVHTLVLVLLAHMKPHHIKNIAFSYTPNKKRFNKHSKNFWIS